MVTSPTFLSLYTGAGGLDLGFIQAGFRPIWANDADPDAVETYRRNIGLHITIGDINELSIEATGLAPEVVIGGPPCQGFSVAGRMSPEDPRSEHVWIFLELVEQLEPSAFVMENVAALALNRRWTPVTAALAEHAEEIGYQTKVFVLNASDYGVPQARARMFLIGLKDAPPELPSPETQGRPPTVRDALRTLPSYGTAGNDSICTARVTPAKRPILRRSPFAGMLFNGKGRPLNLDAPATTLPASMGGNRTPIVDQLQLDGKANECWAVGYHRHLLRGRPPRKTVPKRMRRITLEEAAAMQTFPSDWTFAGKQSAQYRQIGNAVPPRLAYHVALAVKGGLCAQAAPARSIEFAA